MKPLAALYVCVGETIIPCEYGIPVSASNYSGNPDLAHTGFRVTIPAQLLVGENVIEFILVDANGTSRFEPVSYTVSTQKVLN
jgi:hypothetical protein